MPFGNQGNDGGLVLKPLGSLNGGGNGLGGFGADAGMNSTAGCLDFSFDPPKNSHVYNIWVHTLW